MTAIACDGRIIAADTRVSTQQERRDNSNKLHVFDEEVYFKGHRILVVGTAGNVVLSNGAVQALKRYNKGSSFVDFYRDSWQYYNSDKTFSLLIVTDAGPYVFTHNRKGVTLVKCKNNVATIGSGHKVARFLIECFGLPADAAVAGAALDDITVGRLVQWIDLSDRSEGKPKRHTKHYPSRASIIKKIKTLVKGGESP